MKLIPTRQVQIACVLVTTSALFAQNPVPAPPAQPINLAAPPPSLGSFPEELVDIRTLGGHGTALADNFRNALRYDIGGQEIEFLRNERAGPGAPWEELGGFETTAFRIYAIAAREGGDELYVAGFLPNQDILIEEWTVPTRNGGWSMRCGTCPASPLGTPMSSFSHSVQVQGGTYVSPGQGAEIVPSRTALYQGDDFGHIRSMAVDPEGRFLLIHSHAPANLYRFDLTQSPPQLSLLFTPSDLPHLSQARTMAVYDFMPQGRKYLLTEQVHNSVSGAASYTILNDDDNDGIIESFLTLDRAAWGASEYADDDRWLNLIDAGVVLDTGD